MTQKFTRHPTDLEGVTLIKPMLYKDSRGFFLESYNKSEFEKIGINTIYVQDNHSCSAKGVIRGLHYQTIHPQEKIVRVLRGSIFDVVVDIRDNSPSFGKAIGIIVSASDRTMIHIPVGFAHGFLALEDSTEIMYKTSEFYYPQYDAGIIWNDPDLGIAWPFQEIGISEPIVSEKDSKLPSLRDVDTPFP